ncbi:hypothetical protein GCM10007981_15120 [Thermocladium modestius]|uniref:Uncharacterized protein n=1 Tax=Thermocladium modestius TaxID=62609 RepID=A0A830GUW8_9CREN|nr:hypothetical protein [Thermocladium modestius]GGP21808.1 hypothetical protein GCM10007981_15120 [Thermocladium modestius]
MNKSLALLIGNFDKIKHMNPKDVESTMGNILNLLYEVNDEVTDEDCCIKYVIDVLHELLAALHIAINYHSIGNYEERIMDEIAAMSKIPGSCSMDMRSTCIELAKKRETARSLYEGLVHELRLMGMSERSI